MPKIFFDLACGFMCIHPILLLIFYLIYRKTGRCEETFLILGRLAFLVGLFAISSIGITYFLN